MKTKNLLRKAFLLLALVGGVNSAWATDVSVTYTYASSASKATMPANDFFSAASNPTASDNGTFSSNNNMLRCTVTSKTSATVTFTFTAKTSIRLSSFTFSSYVGSNAIKDATVDYYKGSNTPTNVAVTFNKSSSTDVTVTPNSAVVLAANDVFTVKVNLTNTDKSTNRPWQLSTIKLTASMNAPTINTQPMSANYITGAAATALSVAATASSGELSYQWYSNTSASTEGATILTGETSSSYTPSTASSGTTYYYCAVTDANGTKNSDFAAITVGSAYTVATSVNNGEYGTVTATNTYIGGTNPEITATPNSGYKFVSWTVDGVENASTTNPYTFSSIAADHTIQAVFEAIKTVSFTVSSTNNGTRTDNFATELCDENNKFTAPANFYLSSNNQTLTGWSDGKTTYAVGAEIDCSAGSKTLTPVFTTNSGATFAETLDAHTAGFTTTWNLGNSSGATFNMQGKTGYFVRQATINEASVDIPMYIDASSGKYYNIGSDRASNAQVNGGTIFRISVVNGSVVTMVANYPFGTTVRGDGETPCEQTTINGVTTYTLTNSNKTATYTYSGSTGTIDIVIGGDIAYATSISVSYPSPYAVTYDGNGATGGSTTDATTYDKNASVTAKANGFTKTGYAFTGWNTEADGSGTAVAAGAAFSITDNTTLYAQWTAGTGATITYNLKTNSNSTTLDNCNTATPTSGDIVASTTINTYGDANCFGDASAKTDETQKLKIDADYTAANYYEWTFTIGSDVTFTPTQVVMKFQAVSGLTQYKVELTDGTTSQTTNFEQTTSTGGTLETMTWNITPGTTFAAGTTGRLKLWAYKKESKATAFRLGSPITITGAIVPTTITATINPTYGYATFSSVYDVDFSGVAGLTAWKATSSDGTKVVFEQETGKVKAGCGVLLKGATAEIPVTTGGVDIYDAVKSTINMFGCDGSWSELSKAASGTNYVLSVQGGKVVFAPINEASATLSAGQAGLWVAGAGARAMEMSFGDEANAISSVSREATTNNGYYDLQGRRVVQPTKGLYIVNGKKVIIK